MNSLVLLKPRCVFLFTVWSKAAACSATESGEYAGTPLAEKFGYEITFFEERLTPETAAKANGYDATCSFVNDDVKAKTS